MVEPWLRNTLSAVPAVPRAVLHALELARENVEHWTPQLTDEEIHATPFGLTPYAFHVRHMAHSLDRLLTYAEGAPLNLMQRAALSVELEPGMSTQAMLAEFESALREAAGRIRRLPLDQLEAPRAVGAKGLPATLGGLLVHLADHTQRHAGQAVTTAKLLLALRASRAANV
ncbi:DinB family protein [Acidipila sp. EB88]|nr:DinB family protein [Acidipila sp. EB88]